MDIEKLKKLLIKHEGKVLLPYEDTEGYLTIGVGRNLEAVGITEDECELMLKNDIKRVLRDLRRIFENFETFPKSCVSFLSISKILLLFNTISIFIPIIKLRYKHLIQLISF